MRAVATSVLEITHEGLRQFPGGYDYYCEKRDEGRRAAAPAKRQDAEPAASAARAPTSKELRQQRAAERAKIAPKLKELKSRVEKAEKKVDELQAALDAASEELFNPRPDTNFEEANRKVRTLQFEIDRYTAEWEAAATELEELASGASQT